MASEQLTHRRGGSATRRSDPEAPGGRRCDCCGGANGGANGAVCSCQCASVRDDEHDFDDDDDRDHGEKTRTAARRWGSFSSWRVRSNNLGKNETVGAAGGDRPAGRAVVLASWAAAVVVIVSAMIRGGGGKSPLERRRIPRVLLLIPSGVVVPSSRGGPPTESSSTASSDDVAFPPASFPPAIRGRTVSYVPVSKESRKRKPPEEFYFEQPRRLIDNATTNCVAAAEWQRDNHPTCNSVHEVDLTRLDADFHKKRDLAELNATATVSTARRTSEGAHLINGGDYRELWKIDDFDGTLRAKKTLTWDVDYSHRYYEMFRHEAVAMDHLRSSPYVGDIHSYCGLAGLYPLNRGGDLRRRAKYTKFTSNEEKLEAGLHVARSVRDIHAVNEGGQGGRALMAISDLSTNQFVRNHETWIYQLIDLNLVKFITVDAETGASCPLLNAPDAGAVRSPEEYRHSHHMTHAIDLWALGNVLHYLLAGGYAFSTHGYSRKETIKVIKKGKRPPSYDEITARGDPLELGMLEMVKKTRRRGMEDRLAAGVVVKFLEELRDTGRSGQKDEGGRKEVTSGR